MLNVPTIGLCRFPLNRPGPARDKCCQARAGLIINYQAMQPRGETRQRGIAGLFCLFKRVAAAAMKGQAEGKALMGSPESDTSLRGNSGDECMQGHAGDSERAIEQDAAIRRLLRTILHEAPLQETLGECLDILLSVSWLSTVPMGGVFLVGNEPETLELFVERNLAPELRTLCARVPFGHCLCGRAALKREIVHASCVDDLHEIRFEGMAPHGHYNVPIQDGAGILGVIVLYLPDGHAARPDETGFLGAVADIFALAIRQKSNEEKISEASQSEKILDESFNEIYIFDAETLRFQKANRRALENLGYTRKEILALTPVDLAPDFTPDGLRETVAPLRDGSEKRLRFETRMQRKDGSVYPVEVNLQMVGENARAFVAIIVDLSERKAAEDARRTAEERLANAIDALPDGFAVYDADDRLVVFNQRYREMFPESGPATKIGAKFEDILRYGLAHGQYPRAKGREEEWLAERLAIHNAAKGSFEFRLSNGHWIRVIERRTSDGGLVGSRVDITEFKLQNKALELEKKKAERANRAKSEFLANMSHEIRTPLNGVIGMAQLLRKEISDPDQKEKVDIIRDSGERLALLINDILDLAKLESGKLKLQESIFRPSELSRRVLDHYQPIAEEKGLEFEVFTNSSGDIALQGDIGRVFQILHNLVSNAIKFTEKDEVSVLIQARPEEGLKLEVRDTGIGMTPEQLNLVFENFTQADNSLTRRFGGTGLGIGIVHRLVERMGGSFEMKSTLGKGTTALVLLPLSSAEEAAAGVTSGSAA